MGRKVLIVIDMQNDFTYGALRNEEAINVIPNVIEKIQSFDGEIIFTRDTHFDDYLDTQEGTLLPVVHCIKGTHGWELVEQLKIFVEEKGCRVFDKNTFGSIKLARALSKENEDEPIEEIELIGVCTDICVISNAMLLKAHMPNVKLSIDEKCCAGVTVDSHNTAIEAMKNCQIFIK